MPIYRQIEDALDDNRVTDAFAASEPLGDLRRWRGPMGRMVAGRLASHCGAPRLGALLDLLAAREHPDHPRARLVGLRHRVPSMGPAQAWDALEEAAPIFEGAAADLRGEWWVLRGSVAARVRDFESAHAAMERGLAECPDDPWLALQAVEVLEKEDRLDEARARVEMVLEQKPWYRPAIQWKCHFLRSQDQSEAALDLVASAARRGDSGTLHLHWAQLELQLQHWAQAESVLRRFELCAHLLCWDRTMQRALATWRGNIAYHLGRPEEAADCYEASGSKSMKLLAERLRDPERLRRRVELNVPWVRQNHDTCSPATLTAVSRFWGLPAEHLEIAEEICYGGTPGHSERRWARSNGLETREFTVDWETARALIDRGVPFTLVTSDTVNAHIQAVIGYDAHRYSFLCREPSVPYTVEIDVESCLEVLKARGPRGMVLLPPAEVGRLDGLELPEARLYDLYDGVEQGLREHDRRAAAGHLEQLEAEAPGHRLTLTSRLAIAAYDSDLPRQLEAYEALIELFPDDQHLNLARLSCLAGLGRRSDRLAELRRWAEKRDGDPIFAVLLASELIDESRCDAETARLLRRADRLRSDQASVYDLLGRWHWRVDRESGRERALLYLRWAACLGDVVEARQVSYLLASRWLGQVETALDLLRRRFDRLGTRSSLPGLTLVSALDWLDRESEAEAVLEEALGLRPDDPELLLRRASLEARRGELDTANARLDALEGRTAPARLLALRAVFAELAGDLRTALRCAQRLAEREPTAVERHAEVARLLGLLAGESAALRAVQEVTARYPHHRPLAELEVAATWHQGGAAVARVLERQLELDSENAWAWRELASARIQERDYDGAQQALDSAALLDPTSQALDNLRGRLLEAVGRLDEAVAIYRGAIEKDVDNVWAIARLLGLDAPAAAHRDALRFVAGHLGQGRDDAGIEVFLDFARRFLPPEEVLEQLRRFHGERDDSVGLTAMLVEQLLIMDRAAEAEPLVEQGLERWPFLPRMWNCAASLYRVTGRLEDEQKALERLTTLEPADAGPCLRLAGLFLRQGRLDEARREVERGQSYQPLEASLRYMKSEIAWNAGDREEAIDMLEKLIGIDPTHREAWLSLASLGAHVGRPAAALDAARALVEERGDVLAHTLLAEITGDPAEALASVDRALEMEPRSTTLHVLKVGLLADDPEAAAAACRPPVFGDDRPTELVGAEADLRWQQEEKQVAIQLVEEAVLADPGYIEGWRRLTEWYVGEEQWVDAARTVEQWLERAPNATIGRAFRAEVRRQEDPEAALEDLYRALQLDPTYTFAAARSSEIEEELGRMDRALAVVLPLIERQPTSSSLSPRAVELAAKARLPELEAYIHRVAADEAAERPDLFAAVEALAESSPEHLDTWDAVAFSKGANPSMAEVRCFQLAEKKLGRAWKYLEQHARPGHALGAAASLLIRLEVERLGPKKAARSVRRYGELLKGSTATWGQAGWALLSADRPRDTVQWMEDYRQREDAEPWMLFNLNQALRAVGQDDEAVDVSRCALEREGDFDDHLYHHLWIAACTAANGDATYAQQIGDLDEESMDEECRELYHLARAVAAAAGRAGDRQAFDEARYWLVGDGMRYRKMAPQVARIYHRARRRIGKEIGGFWPRLWSVLI